MNKPNKKFTYWYKKEVLAANLGEAERLGRKERVVLDSVTVEELKHEARESAIGFAVED